MQLPSASLFKKVTTVCLLTCMLDLVMQCLPHHVLHSPQVIHVHHRSLFLPEMLLKRIANGSCFLSFLPLAFKEYTDELNYLLTIVKHPRTTQVLQNALSAVEQPLEESRPAPDATKQGTTTAGQTVTVQPISTSTQPRETLTYPTTKISQYGM